MAYDERGKPVAGALNLAGARALYGRNWGAAEGTGLKHLHFELCYYQARPPFLGAYLCDLFVSAVGGRVWRLLGAASHAAARARALKPTRPLRPPRRRWRRPSSGGCRGWRRAPRASTSCSAVRRLRGCGRAACQPARRRPRAVLPPPPLHPPHPAPPRPRRRQATCRGRRTAATGCGTARYAAPWRPFWSRRRRRCGARWRRWRRRRRPTSWPRPGPPGMAGRGGTAAGRSRDAVRGREVRFCYRTIKCVGGAIAARTRHRTKRGASAARPRRRESPPR